MGRVLLAEEGGGVREMDAYAIAYTRWFSHAATVVADWPIGADVRREGRRLLRSPPQRNRSHVAWPMTRAGVDFAEISRAGLRVYVVSTDPPVYALAAIQAPGAPPAEDDPYRLVAPFIRADRLEAPAQRLFVFDSRVWRECGSPFRRGSKPLPHQAHELPEGTTLGDVLRDQPWCVAPPGEALEGSATRR